MAKGAASKEQITQKILQMFDGAFKYDKEIRIPMVEDGEEIQIKCSLTCAKTNVEAPDTPPFAGAAKVAQVQSTDESLAPAANFMNEPTTEEKEAVAELIRKLGIA